MSKSTRSITFDLLRILLVTLVLHLHLASKVRAISDYSLPRIELLAVPLFFVLSFYLTSKYYIAGQIPFNILKERINRLLVPFIFWSLISFSAHISAITPINIIYQMLTGNLFSSPLYYLRNLMEFTIIFYLLSKIKFSIRIVIYFIIITTAFFLQYSGINYLLFTTQVADYRNIFGGRFLEFIPYPTIGLLFSIYSHKLNKYISIFTVIVAFSMLGLVLTWNIPMPKGFVYQGVKYFFGTIVIFTIFHKLYKIDTRLVVNNKIKSFIGILGRYTFGVYLCHYTILEIFVYFFPSLKKIMLVNLYSSLIVFLILSYSICILFDKLTKNKLAILIS